MSRVGSTVLTFSILASACDRADRPHAEAAGRRETSNRMETRKLKLSFGDTTLQATLADHETARDFASLLPLTLPMNDLFRREKYAHLPRPISAGGQRVFTYEIGQIVYWSPGPDVAVFYRDDGESIPHPGIIVIGKVDSGAETLDVQGTIEVKIEREGPR